jgi:2-iminobutanoate/2-iminopropanoate deaminase
MNKEVINMSKVTRQPIVVDAAPKPVGPYTHAVRVGNLLYLSGCGPIDPVTGEVCRGTIEEQTRLVLNNLKIVCEAAGSSFKHVVKVLAFLKDIKDFDAYNKTYGEFFSYDGNAPARSTIQADLWNGILVELEMVAFIPDPEDVCK